MWEEPPAWEGHATYVGGACHLCERRLLHVWEKPRVWEEPVTDIGGFTCVEGPLVWEEPVTSVGGACHLPLGEAAAL